VLLAVLRPYLDLARVQLTPTAVADSFAGYCLVVVARKCPPSAGTAVALALTSIFSYWMGMATNDLLDLEKDRRRGASRPLVRGELRPSSGWIFAGLLAAGALLASLSVSMDAALGASSVMTAALLYNAGGKRLPILGNLLMGSCRAGNLLLGALGAVTIRELTYDEDLSFQVLEGAGILGLYIAGVTSVSVLEDISPRPVPILVTTFPLLIVPVALTTLAWPRPWAVLNALLLAGLLLRAMVRAARDAASPGAGPHSGPEPPPRRPHPAQGFVRTGLWGLFLVDSGVLLARDAREVWGPVVVLYGLMILAWLWPRQWLQSFE
jgi:hypothetical protein